ncbi:hypothetical protein NPS33_28120 [Pseudomonas putida]|uniref:hypothetical protein n=1 Tax=Pseudomonas TaxID=286 RepID=UPI002363C2C3|nr:hypothetical protein [Pseudomonas putida]MDD2018701.1 hypothetical protein [Pseudomonas putida]HDS1775436.1 hypothetical protein [Pseudomonas putida]
MKTRTASFIGLAIWIAFLWLGKPSASLISYSVPFGIALIATGPLELIPDRWHRLNFLVNVLATGFFFVSIMFAIVAISFALALSKSECSIFCLAGWAMLLIVYHFAIPWLKRSPFHRLSEDRGMYSPPTDDDKRN